MASPTRFPLFGGFLRQVAASTAHLLGADRVDLRSFARLPPSEQHISGAAYIGWGRMEVGHEVPGFIEDLLDRPRPQPTADQLEQLRKIVGTLLHESIHLALPNDYTPRLGRTTPSEIFLEEGVTESATQALLPHLLARLESQFPKVSQEVPDRSRHYPNYVPATRDLLSVVSGLPEMRGRNALRELARVGPERKMDLLVEQAMEGFGLTFNVPARDREEVRSRIRAALETQVQRNHGWMVPPDRTKPRVLNTREPDALSTIMGKQMGFELLRQLHAEGERVAMELPEGWRARFAQEELRVAQKLLGRNRFTGAEATEAIESWIVAATKMRGPHSAAIPIGEDWLRRARRDHRRASRARRAHTVRGMTG